MTVRRHLSRVVTAVCWVLVLAVLAGAVVTVAGSAVAAVASPAAGTVEVSATIDGVLVPGAAAGTADVTLSNPGTGYLRVTRLVAEGAATSSATCPPTAVLVPAGQLLEGPVEVPAGTTVHVTVAAPALDAAAPVGCRGVWVTVDLDASAVAG